MAIIKENNGDASADSGTPYTLSLGDVFQVTLSPLLIHEPFRKINHTRTTQPAPYPGSASPPVAL